MIVFAAPFTTGFEGVLPKGEVLIAEEPNEGATGVYLVPERYEYFEQLFVPASESTIPEYGGYAVSLSFNVLESSFEKI